VTSTVGSSNGSPGESEAAEPNRGPRLTAPTPVAPPKERRQPVLRPARLSGDRDWPIFIECQADAAVVYPSRVTIPVAAVVNDRDGNPLLHTVQNLIDRRQATVRPGEVPYRPQILLLYRLEHLRTYHQVYPALYRLNVPKKAVLMEPEDDVLSVISSY
jgi:hypothetical protein